MFDSNNESPRRGGNREDANPRAQYGAKRARQRFVRSDVSMHAEKIEPRSRHYSLDSDGVEGTRPKFNPNERASHVCYVDRPFAKSPGRSEGGMADGRRSANPVVEGKTPHAGVKKKRNPSLYSKAKQREFIEEYEDPTVAIRLNKYLANAGICSRREADDFIQAGVITVNGEVVSSLGAKVLPTDKVMFHDQPVRREQKVYMVLNKPKNTVTTTDDPEERHTVLDIVRTACSERIYPVGRLDRNTTGVLLLTNDGDLAAKLTHPKFGKRKVYAVMLDRDFEEADEAVLRAGVMIDDELVAPDELAFPKEDRRHLGIEIHSGQNRVVRRMFEQVGYRVVSLDRTSFAGITKKNVPRGHYRFLTAKEVSMLKMGAFE